MAVQERGSKRRWPGRWVAALLLGWLWATPARAQARDPAQAKEHLERAMAHVDRRAYRAAVDEFRRAYEAAPHYSVLYNLGQAYVLLDEPVQAIEAFERYLEQGDDRIAAERVEEVRQALAEQRQLVGELLVRGLPAGAAITVDGRPAGRAPLDGPLVLRRGRHLLEASLPGHVDAAQWVDVAQGRAETVGLTLEPHRPPPHPTEISGQVAIRCPIPGVAVHIDDRIVGHTPLEATVLAKPGRRLIRFGRSGYRFRSAQVALRAGQVSDVACEAAVLEPLPAVLAARLTVRAMPADGVQVLVDGVAGPSTRTLPLGPHRVVVRRFGHEPWSRSVRLEHARSLELRADLDPTPGYLHEQHTRSEIQRITAYVVGGAGLALGAATGIHFAWNHGRHDDWSEEDVELQQQWSGALPQSPDLAERQADNDELLRSVLSADRVTVGLGVGAGALLAAGVALWITGDDPSDFEVGASPTARGAALSLQGRW